MRSAIRNARENPYNGDIPDAPKRVAAQGKARAHARRIVAKLAEEVADIARQIEHEEERIAEQHDVFGHADDDHLRRLRDRLKSRSECLAGWRRHTNEH